MGTKKRLVENKGKALANRLRQARLASGLTQVEAGEKTRLASMSISRYERGTVEPGLDALSRMAAAYKLTIDALIKGTNAKGLHAAKEIPVRGWVAAGTPRDAYEEDLGTTAVPDYFTKSYPKCFALTVSGDSLAGDGIHNGNTLIVDPDARVKQGAIYIVRIGDEFCARHLHIENGHVRLKASNRKYSDLKVADLQTLGRVVGHIRKM